jgi:mycothiol synthase
MRDLEQAAALFNACSMAERGREEFDVEELRVEWNTPHFDLARDTRCILAPDGAFVGYVELWDSAPHIVLWSWGRVHPDVRGRGLGTAMLAWTEARAQASLPGAPEGARVVLRQGVQATSKDAQALLAAKGYARIRSFYRMAIDLEEAAPLPEPHFPAGIHLRTFVRDEDLPALIHADRDAIRDHRGFVERPFEVELKMWAQRIDEDPDFDPDLWFLAMDGDEIAGLCTCWPKITDDPEMGWVGVLGVRRPWRRRGLALAMLHHTFREFERRGQRRVGLGVDASSLTGATRLYEKAGMHVARESYTYEKELRAGEDLSTQTLD